MEELLQSLWIGDFLVEIVLINEVEN